MKWEYKIAEVTDIAGTYYDVRELYHTLHGPVWSEEPEHPIAETLDELIWELRHMLKAAKKARRDPRRLMKIDEKGVEI